MELSKKIYDKQFTTVTSHKNVQNYYNEKCAKFLMFDLKKYRGVIFSPEQLKVSKLGY